MKTKAISILCACAALTAAPDIALGQIDMRWWAIDGGGGTSSGGNYALQGSIGETAGGSMTGGSFSIAGGWSGAVAVPIAGAPTIHINRTATGGVIVSWAGAGSGWVLEEIAALNSPLPWTPVSSTASQTNGTEVFVVLPPQNDARFYRLRR